MAAVVPVLAIDGPSGSGKGTLAQVLAKQLGWHLLDSGALYRIVGLAAVEQGVDLDDGVHLACVAEHLDVKFTAATPGEPTAVWLNGRDISDAVRSENSGYLASRVAVFSEVRKALHDRQRAFAQAPGLVADGRDMGTEVFPDAPLKIFLTASAEERAQRRYKQLMNKGESVNLAALLEDIQARDRRDTEREVAPLRPADDAVVIDSTHLDIGQVVQQVLVLLRQRQLVS
jgi:cytidylate kinase